MDIDQLIAFDRIVRAGSFSRAAWDLHIAQPTIQRNKVLFSGTNFAYRL